MRGLLFQIMGIFLVYIGVNLLMIAPVQSHEIRPALLEFEISPNTPDQLNFTLDMTAELFLSGSDASAIDNTDDSENAELYDQLRQLDPAKLTAEMQRQWPVLARKISIENGGRNLDLVLQDIQVETGLDPRQIRQTKIYFTAGKFYQDAGLVLSWSAQLGPLMVRQSQTQNTDRQDQDSYAAFLLPGQKTAVIHLDNLTAPSLKQVATTYIHSGFIHIIPQGMDHILFVLGLFLFSLSGRVLIYQISLFTLAHTLTLALSSMGIIVLSADIVEPLIALSIVYVALEIFWAKGRLSLQRGLLITGFGLLHGMGFASVLADFGLPDTHFIPALISFNIGVELGQLALVLPLFAVLKWVNPPALLYRIWVQIPSGIAIAAIAVYWVGERISQVML